MEWNYNEEPIGNKWSSFQMVSYGLGSPREQRN